MSHPPALAIAIVGVLAVATATETYRSAHRPRPAIGKNATAAVTPAQQLDRAPQALRIDSKHDGIAPTM